MAFERITRTELSGVLSSAAVVATLSYHQTGVQSGSRLVTAALAAAVALAAGLGGLLALKRRD